MCQQQELEVSKLGLQQLHQLRPLVSIEAVDDIIQQQETETSIEPSRRS